jgi:hypothetical protein
MIIRTLLIAALALTTCTTQPLATHADQVARPHNVEALIDFDTLDWFQGVTSSRFTLPRWGGSRTAAMAIATIANQRGQTFVVEGEGLSATVTVALMVDRIEVRNPNARWFGLHESGVSPNWRGNSSSGYKYEPAFEQTELLFNYLGIPNCLRWMRAQTNNRANRVVYVSWNFLKKDCKE